MPIYGQRLAGFNVLSIPRSYQIKFVDPWER